MNPLNILAQREKRRLMNKNTDYVCNLARAISEIHRLVDNSILEIRTGLCNQSELEKHSGEINKNMQLIQYLSTPLCAELEIMVEFELKSIKVLDYGYNIRVLDYEEFDSIVFHFSHEFDATDFISFIDQTQNNFTAPFPDWMSPIQE
jgi:hypothetical protein